MYDILSKVIDEKTKKCQEVVRIEKTLNISTPCTTQQCGCASLQSC